MFESYKIGVLVDIQGDALAQLDRLAKIAGVTGDAFDRLALMAQRATDALSVLAGVAFSASDALDGIAASTGSASMGLDRVLMAGRSTNRMLLTMERRATTATASMERLSAVSGTAGIGGRGGAVLATGGGGSHHSHSLVAMAIGGAVASVGAGIYQYDNVAKALAAIQMTRDSTVGLNRYRAAMERIYAHYGYASNGQFEPFGEAMNKIVQLTPRFDPQRQIAIFNRIAPFAASEAMIKHIPFSEAMASFIEVMHQAGAYTRAKMDPLMNAILTMSKVSPMNLGRITNTLSYALPVATSLGISPEVVMMQMAALMQSGIRNSKSGTWLADFYLNSMPEVLGSGLFKNKNQVSALDKLGLLKGKHMEFLDKSGHLDTGKLLSILAGDRSHMSATMFTSMIELAFGKQGARAVSMLTEPFVMKNLRALIKMDSANARPEPGVMKHTPGGAWSNFAAQLKSLWMAGGQSASGPFSGMLNLMSGGIHDMLPWARRHSGITDGALATAGGVAAYGLGAAFFHREFLGKMLFKEGPAKLAEVAKAIGPTIEGILGAAAPILADIAVVAIGSTVVYELAKKLFAATGIEAAIEKSGVFHAIDKFIARGMGSLPPATHSIAYQQQHPVVVHTHVHMDGKQVATAVTKHLAPHQGPVTSNWGNPHGVLPFGGEPLLTGG